MKKVSKALLLILCAVMLIAASVLGTMAYLTSSDEVVNTFTYGKVNIKLDEAVVDEYGKPDENNRTEKSTYNINQYKLIPNCTYTKDPTVTVVGDSEECYIRILVQVSDVEKLETAFPKDKYPSYWNGNIFLLQSLVNWDSSIWNCVEATAEGRYVFDYKSTVSTVDAADKKLEPLFTTLTVPGIMTNSEVAALDQVKVTITAYAVQKAGFESAGKAFNAAFGTVFNSIVPAA